jgi:hypothetical protein
MIPATIGQMRSLGHPSPGVIGVARAEAMNWQP